jgi:hypothetical protein
METQRVLTLVMRGRWFDAIKAGTKTEEFRLCTPYWRRRLIDATPDVLVLTRGYAKRDDTSRRLTLAWRGVRVTTIRHPEFGPRRVRAYAIDVTGARSVALGAPGDASLGAGLGVAPSVVLGAALGGAGQGDMTGGGIGGIQGRGQE